MILTLDFAPLANTNFVFQVILANSPHPSGDLTRVYALLAVCFGMLETSAGFALLA